MDRFGIFLIVMSWAWSSVTWAQGNPTPGDPPGPVMKTLRQVEPRIDLANAPASVVNTADPDFAYTINASGSYYLSGNAGGGGIGPNVKPGVIKILADNVTLDLMGFEIIGNDPGPGIGTAPGIAIAVHTDNVLIRNGKIRNFQSGITVEETSAAGTIVRDVTVFRIDGWGIDLGDKAQVCDCQVSECLEGGLRVGHGAMVQNCISANHRPSVANVVGIACGRQGNVNQCIVRDIKAAGATGIEVEEDTVVSNCTVTNLNSTSAVPTTGIGGTQASVYGCTVNGADRGYRFTGGAIIAHDSQALNCTTGFEVAGGAMANCVAQDCETGFQTSSAGQLLIKSCTSTAAGISTAGNKGFHIETDGAQLRDCLAAYHLRNYFVEGNNNVIRDCSAHGKLSGSPLPSGSTNFRVTGSANVLEGNYSLRGFLGFHVTGSDNLVISNKVADCNTDFALGVSTQQGERGADPSAMNNAYGNITF